MLDAWDTFDVLSRTAAGEWHIFTVEYSGDEKGKAMALGRRFPTGWTELKDGTVAASPHTSGSAKGLKVKDTGKTITKAEMVKRQKKAGADRRALAVRALERFRKQARVPEWMSRIGEQAADLLYDEIP